MRADSLVQQLPAHIAKREELRARLPAGTFWMGGQADNPDGRNHFAGALPGESPVHEVGLSAYFFSKYELTQGQWARMMGQNPSYFGPAGEWEVGRWSRTERDASLLHPVEQVSWYDAEAVLRQMELALPSEAQWEYAARAGSSTPWWTGADARSLNGAANLNDAFRRTRGGSAQIPSMPWDDGSFVHAPVGSYRPNAFGFHDLLGNVWEWCLDRHDPGFFAASPFQDPVSDDPSARNRIFRGGSFYDEAIDARCSDRDSNEPEGTYDDVGIRPARRVVE
jgi:sulfatase modifying factor 1